MSHLGDLPSEQINPRSMGLDLLSCEEIVDVINADEQRTTLETALTLPLERP